MWTLESRAKMVASWEDRRKRTGCRDIKKIIVITKPEVCDLCQAKPPTHLDHDHQTGRTRGYLCGRCNHSITLIDDGLLEKARAYIANPPRDGDYKDQIAIRKANRQRLRSGWQ